MSNSQFTIAGRELQLSRFPKTRDRNLQPWDSADELIINHLVEQKLIKADHNLMVLNDDFGALSCFFARDGQYFVSDSYLSTIALRKNLHDNDIDALVETLDPLRLDPSAFESKGLNKIDVVILKIPRTLALLEYELFMLRRYLTPNTIVIAGAKVKAITNSVLQLFERYLGPTKTSLAKKKSRLIFCSLDKDLLARALEAPSSLNQVDDASISFSLFNHANVFCREHLDIGARFLLANLRENQSGKGQKVIDLGCGNGVLGTAHHLLNPEDDICFCDESYMAVASAQMTFCNAGNEDKARFIVGHSLRNIPNDEQASFDLVLCNPPFHQQNTLTDEIAWQMFSDAKDYLKINGELRIVANRHLDYLSKLRKLFGGASVIATNKKFTVLSAIRRK